jgi:hypothetical protein
MEENVNQPSAVGAFINRLSDVMLALLGLVFVVTLFISIMAIRRDHPHHIHTLWYTFSLTLCAVFILLTYAYYTAAPSVSRGTIFSDMPPLSGLPGRAALFFMHTSMDSSVEILTLLTIGLLLILPQVMSYVISGLFGCASPPILVSTVSKIVTWSFIKFFCVLSGILAATLIAALCGHAPPFLHPLRDATVRCVDALLAISISFLTMAIYYKTDILYKFITRLPCLGWFDSFTRFMTRYEKITALDPATRSLLDVNSDFRIHDIALRDFTLSGKVKAYLHLHQSGPFGFTMLDVTVLDMDAPFAIDFASLLSKSISIFSNGVADAEIFFYPNPNRVCGSVSVHVNLPNLGAWFQTFNLACVQFSEPEKESLLAEAA